MSCPGGRDLCAEPYCRRRSRGRTTRARLRCPLRTRAGPGRRGAASNKTRRSRPTYAPPYGISGRRYGSIVSRSVREKRRFSGTRVTPGHGRPTVGLSTDVRTTKSTRRRCYAVYVHVSRRDPFTWNVLYLRSYFRTWPKSVHVYGVWCTRVLRARARTVTAGHHVNSPAGTNRFRTREHTDGQAAAAAAAAAAAVAGGRGRRSRVRPTLGCHPRK